MKKIFFDMEFTGLHKNTSIISIGLVDENDNKFYAELSDFELDQCDEWIRENILSKLISNSKSVRKQNRIYKVDNFYYGDKQFVRDKLLKWLGTEDNIQFISDVSHYDFVLLIDLISGHALTLPKNISPYCHDINQDIARYYNVSDAKAFDMTREDIMDKIEGSNEKHNALFDAIIIKNIYEKINKKQ